MCGILGNLLPPKIAVIRLFSIDFAFIYYMHLRRIQIILFLIAFYAGLCGLASAEEDRAIYFDDEFYLLELINEARENPLVMASSLGMDPEQILEDLPELNDILTVGLPPLTFNGDLYSAASAHSRDMLENYYYSHDSLDGRTINDRIIESGYQPAVTGESLGMVAFFNFIQPAEAVRFIFEDMFKDELNPVRTERRNILAPDLQEVGIGFGFGTFEMGGSIYNVYLTACDFATSSISLLELELLELINQARENPLAVSESLGMDPEQILEDLPELNDILTGGLPPLTFNADLYGAARAHAWDMLENDYYSHVSIDGRTVDDRVRDNGYLPRSTGEVMRLLATVDFVEASEGARIHFERIFREELDPGCTDRTILNPEIEEAGISFLAVSPDMGEASSGMYRDYYTLLMVADFGASAARETQYLKGRVYGDLDGNGLYSIGEGLEGFPIFIEGHDTTRYAFTNRAGGLVADLEPGTYRIIAEFYDEPMERWVEMIEGNVGFEFRIEAR
jgi:uncharacterized protein YkwD